MGKIWAIPDIHGEMELLSKLLTKLRDEERINYFEDHLIFLGDMVDRGPNSAGVLHEIKGLCEMFPSNVIALYGNHEDLMVKALTDKRLSDWQLWMMNGGDQTVASFGSKKVPEDILAWLGSLPLSLELPGFFFSHAPVPREEDRHSTLKGKPFSKSELTWTYHHNESEMARDFGNEVGVCGHVHRLRQGVAAPRLYDHYLFLDAGAGCATWAPLIAVEVKSRRVVSVDHSTEGKAEARDQENLSDPR